MAEVQYYGLSALVRILVHFAFIYISFWSLQSLNIEKLFKAGVHYNKQITILYFLVSIVIGYMASQFFFEILQLVKNMLQFGL